MPGALLRTGNLQEFKALGVDGQPVYSAALQLREAIRLKMGREAASCLAVPQPNETGDRIDWYAPLEGDVVPWSTATTEERAQAYTQLEAMHAQLGNTSATMRGDAQSREKQIFGRLLEKAVNFPDSNHVYLVDGKPVITFWGFTDHAGTYDHDPLLCLRPPVPSAAAPVAPLAPPLMAAVPVEAVTKSRWWRWLWLLLLPLLLLLLLLLMRACAPTVELPLGLDRIDLPGLPAVDVRGRNISGYGGVVDSGGTVLDGQAVDGLEPPAADAGDQGVPAADDAAAPEQEPTPPADDAAEQEPPAEPEQEQPQEAEPPQEQPQSEPAQEQPQPREQPPGRDVPQDLSIPPQALETGSTEFLNGNWNAGAGIQDAQTGKPMQLDYDFKDGKGQVKVRRGDGVECTGPVSAAMQGGKLAINSQGQAACNDGSSYKLPQIVCSPDARSAADCTGSYENKQFPMSMRQSGQ